MSSLPISMEEEPQCVLQLFLPSATWLKIKLKALQSSVKVEHVEEKESSQKVEIKFWLKSKVKVE